MKFNFRKIASAVASTALMGSTVALAAAATFPQPFVSTSGTANYVAVYGSQLDLAAVTDITTALSAVTTSSGSTDAPTEGDFVLLEKANDKLNLGDTLSGVFGSTVDDGDLSTILADGVFINDNNEEFEYTQELTLVAHELEHLQDNDVNSEEPFIGFQIDRDASILNYTLDFTPDDAEGGAAWTSADHYFEGSTIEMLGKSWYILDVDNNAGLSMDLLDSASSATVYEGDSITVTAGSTTYEVSIGYIDDTSVRLIVNGEQTNFLEEDETQQLSDGSYLGVRDIGFQGFAGGIGLAEFSIGSGKLELVHGDEVTLNGDQINELYDEFELYVYFTNGTNAQDLRSIEFEWIAGDDIWLYPGSDVVLPGLGALKLSMTEFEVPLTETTTITYDSTDKWSIETEVEDGEVEFNLFFLNATGTGIDGLGADTDETLVTSASSEIIVDKEDTEWFVASWASGTAAESYVLYVSDIDDTTPSRNTTTLKSRASNEAVTLDIGDTEELGEISITLNSAREDTGAVNLTIGASSEWDVLYTKEGLKLQLPVSSVLGTTTNGAGLINITGDQAEWTAQFFEEDEDGNIADGTNFNVTLSISEGETTVGTVVGTSDRHETSDGSDDYEGYVESELATRVLERTGGDQDDVIIEYHGDETKGNVYVAQVGSGSGSAGGLSVMDSELVSSGMSTKNLVVVGGTCVNSIAADLLGVPESTCGSAWTTATETGSGEYVIQTFANPWAGTKVATLVAGWAQADTANAATYLTTQEPTTDVGVKYTGTAGTSATMVAG